jgi:cold shock CspA family protein
MSEKEKLATVVSWREERFFGFAEPEDGGADIFIHGSVVRAAGLGEKLSVGDRAYYSLGPHPRRSDKLIVVALRLAHDLEEPEDTVEAREAYRAVT